MTNAALILVDIQNDYFEGGSWPLDRMDLASAKASKILQHARDHGIKMVHIHHESLSDNAPFFKPGTKGAEIHASVAPLAEEEVILKHFPNSFHKTGLHESLQSNGIKRLIIIGAMSQICIDATTRAASDLGYDVTVIHDACAAKETEFKGVTVPAAQVHASFMSALNGTYAAVVDCESYFAAS